MANQMIDLRGFLESAKQDIMLGKELAKQEEGLRVEYTRLEKSIQSEKKALNTQIESTIARRRAEVSNSFDMELNSTREKLEKVRGKRQKEKKVKVKGRISDETADLIKENQDLKRRIKDEFKKDKVPFFCNSNWYFSLFMPSNVFDFLKLFLLFLIFYGIVPLGIYYYIPNRKVYYLVIIYLACVFVFGGIWAIFAGLTKLRHLETLKLVRNLRKTIRNNQKKMDLIKKGIKSESDDSVYALEDFDVEIRQIENELNLVQQRRQQAIDTFENETKIAISNELQNTSKPVLDQLESEFANIKTQLEEVGSQRKIKTMFIADRYEGYLGREFMNTDKLDRLIHICEEGEFQSISELLEQYRNRLE